MKLFLHPQRYLLQLCWFFGLTHRLHRIYRSFRSCLNQKLRESWVRTAALNQRIQSQINEQETQDKRFLSLIAPTGQESKRTALLVHSLSISALPLEAALCWALQKAGYDVVVLSGREGDKPTAYFRHIGVRHFISWEDISLPMETRLARNRTPAITTPKELFRHEFNGIQTGRYATSTALRALRIGSLQLSAKQFSKMVIPCLEESIFFAAMAPRLLSMVNPSLIISQDVGYTPRGQLFNLALNRGIDTITWNNGHKDNTLILKRYSRNNAAVHPASLSDASWLNLREMQWTNKHRQQLLKELESSYSDGSWYSEVGTHFQSHMHSLDEVKKKLALNPKKKTAVIFSHMFWDATFFYGEDLFENYQDWFIRTVDAACKNDRLNWIIKVHPGNVVKNKRIGIGAEPSLEIQALDREIQDLPQHVKLMLPETDISTFSLYQVTDYALTVRGTIGIEAAALGIRVLTAGTGRYDQKGFTIDSESSQDYLDRLSRLEKIPEMTDPERELAERFAYGVFIRRPLQLSTIRLGSHRDETASPNIKITAKTASEWTSATDMIELYQWIMSADEDYLSQVRR